MASPNVRNPTKKNIKQNSHNLFREDLVQTHVRPLFAPFISVSPFEPWLLGLVGYVFLMPSISFDIIIFPASLQQVLDLQGEGTKWDLNLDSLSA